MGPEQGSFQVMAYALLGPVDSLNVSILPHYRMGQTGKFYAWHWPLYMAWDILTGRL